jgi:hypothetical protein
MIQTLSAENQGKAGGALTLKTAKGNLVVSLAAPPPATAGAVPSAYSFVITSGTGAYQHATGHGTVTLAMTPSKKASKPGTFTLTFKAS